MPVEYGPHQPGDRMAGHEPESWPPWLCTDCGQPHESDPRLGCVGYKAVTPQPTLEELQGKGVHRQTPEEETAAKFPGSATAQALAAGKLPSLADRIAAAQPAPSTNPVLLDSLRMIVREELQQAKLGHTFTTKERDAITQGLRIVLAHFSKIGRNEADDSMFPSDEELAALITRLEP